jgi:hypothetical protein
LDGDEKNGNIEDEESETETENVHERYTILDSLIEFSHGLISTTSQIVKQPEFLNSLKNKKSKNC